MIRSRRFFSGPPARVGPMIHGAVPLTSQRDEDEEMRLMAAVATGERSAQTALLERLAPRVRRLALMLARSSADADDAAQQALLEILRSSGNYRTPGNLVAWSDRIAARTVLHLRRQERARESLLARWLSPGTQPWGGADHAVGLETAGLEALFRTLSHARREVMVLRHALGYSPEEIAELTGAPLGTVKDRLAAGRKQLRQLLERDRKGLERGGPR